MAGLQQQHWQPQGVDTRNGAINHLYIPRSDGQVAQVGGYIPSPKPGCTPPSIIFVGIPPPSGPPAPPGGYPGGYGDEGGGIAGMPPGMPGGFPYPVPTVPVEIKPDGEVNAMVPPLNAAAPLPAQPIVYPQYPAYSALPAPQHHNGGYIHYQNIGGGPIYPNTTVQPEGTYNGNYYTNPIQQPAINYHGLTSGENQSRQLATAFANDMNKPQEIRPTDPDQFRMYWVRDLDGTYVQHNLLTINSGDIGDVRWYIVDGGTFYAVKLPAN